MEETSRLSSPFTLVQCFYGLDKARIIAVTKAMQHMLRSDPMPAEWIFVEAQKKKDEAQFAWLENYGIKHKFIKTTAKHDDIPLKSALWNIGADEAKHENLAFLDADCWLRDLSWAEAAAPVLEECDFCSLSEVCIYSEKPDNKIPSVAAKWKQTCEASSTEDMSNISFGHCGFTLGAKKAAFNAVGKMATLPVLEDIHFWSRVFGSSHFYNRRDLLLWDSKQIEKPAREFTVGCVQGECIHVFHGNYSQRQYASIFNVARLVAFDPFQGITEHKHLPCWDSTRCGKFMHKFMHELKENNANVQLAVNFAIKEIS